jgi:hypothetical protein
MFEKNTSATKNILGSESVIISAERYEQLLKAEITLEICKNTVKDGGVKSYNYGEYFRVILGIEDGDKDGAE